LSLQLHIQLLSRHTRRSIHLDVASAALNTQHTPLKPVKMGKKKNKSAQQANQAQAHTNGTSTPASTSDAADTDQPDISAVDIALDPDTGHEQADEPGEPAEAVMDEADAAGAGTAAVEPEAAEEEAGPSARRATAELAALEDVQKAAEEQVASAAVQDVDASIPAARAGHTGEAAEQADGGVEQRARHGHVNGDDRIRDLEDELARVRDEKDALDGQYRGLLGKLTMMRKSLGDKLREDAVC
jgi:hypothetical protein